MTSKNNALLIVLVIIAALLAGGAVCWLFLSIKQNSETFFAQKGALAELEKKSENLKRFQLTYINYQANLEKIDRLFVDNEEPVEFIKFLEKEASSSKLTINLVPLAAPKAGKDDVWPSTSFQVDMVGSFSKFLQFLDKIESSPYLIALSNFNLVKPTKTTNGDINVSFQMKVYNR